jgi:hypothetical protein
MAGFQHQRRQIIYRGEQMRADVAVVRSQTDHANDLTAEKQSARYLTHFLGQNLVSNYRHLATDY